MSITRTSARNAARLFPALAFGAVLANSASAQVRQSVNEFGNPMKIAPRPTAAAITQADLQTRLYIFSDDSMTGRQIGRVGNMKGTTYIASELQKLGVLPGNWDGTYFQNFGYVQRKFLPASKMSVNGAPLAWNAEFVALPNGVTTARQIDSAQVIFGGVTGDSLNTITATQAAGKVVLLLPRPAGVGAGAAGGRGGRGGGGGQGAGSPFPDAAAIVTIDLDALNMASRAELNNPQASNPLQGAGRGGAGGRGGAAAPGAAQTPAVPPLAMRVTRAAAEKLLGRALNGATPGMLGGTVRTNLAFVTRTTNYARNVIGIIPGSDPQLKGQYVAISAHNDHVGFRAAGPIDHDSAKVRMSQTMKARIKDNETLINSSPELVAGLAAVNLDSLRKLRPARPDSINNGADDDGSGSMGILEIAEFIQKMPVKPKRSVIFIWHTGEEAGMDGSRGVVSDPPIPLDSIVTAINVDMIGRGREGDMPGGGNKYLGVVGSKVISMDVSNQVAATNKKQPNPFNFDFRYDTNVVWTGYQNIYSRSDHINYANAGIPIVFFFTGLHADYHQVTDEAQYIDYPHYAAIDNFIKDLVLDLANGPKPSKNGIGRKDQPAGRGGAGGAPAAGAAGGRGGGGNNESQFPVDSVITKAFLNQRTGGQR